ncbi:phosphonate metabolism protein/1,5-bisphosphokinase (PRPP-forming) PhnN [Pelagibacterium sp.]|uniref:phosphonate metabolism protein/1,5-bisphosphokinase (PRPP-forming) PhnN n=1 Tax=Pelagibacterium sp. TaxID=1967288 RepID=UPI003A946024
MLPRGRFAAVVGQSGAGKDTLLKGAAQALADRTDICFVRRVITRAPDGATEDHDTLSTQAFATARAAGKFCLTWQAHGLCYGPPVEIMARADRGTLLIANVSRGILDEASSLFQEMTVINIEADEAVLARRIAARGRESAEAVAMRLARRVPLKVDGRKVHTIDNSFDVASGTKALVTVLNSL